MAQRPLYEFGWELNKILPHPSERNYILDGTIVPQNTFNGQLSNKNIKRLNAIIPDFQVNENTGANGAGQDELAISADSNGNFIMTWWDDCNGDNDIYAQRSYLIDGVAVGNKF